MTRSVFSKASALESTQSTNASHYSLDAVLGLRHGKFRPITGAVELALRALEEHTRITVELYNVGGGSIVLDDQPSTLRSLRDVASKFPSLAVNQSERIYAMLTRFDSLSSFHAHGTQNPAPIRYDHCAFYANMLLDAFVEYRNIDRQLSAHMAAVRFGSMRFEQDELAPSGGKRRFANSTQGITRAKRE